jgi:hypothetical protein
LAGIEHFPGLFLYNPSPSIGQTDQTGENMKADDIQVMDLTSNFEKLKDENKEKLLLVGKRLLSIKSLVMNEKNTKKIENKEFKNE